VQEELKVAEEDKGVSKWLLALSKEREAKEQQVDPSKAARIARLAHLFQDSSDEEPLETKAENKLDDKLD
jgi:hypothetical protein